jgi:hypothetical protein
MRCERGANWNGLPALRQCDGIWGVNALETAVYAHNHAMLKKIEKSALQGVDKCREVVYNNIRRLGNTGHGSIAQLGEHLPYKQRVTGSSPVVPTILMAK